MKKTYQQPAMIIVTIKAKQHMLAGTGVTTNSTLGNEFNGSDVSYSRDNKSVWDDEDEEDDY